MEANNMAAMREALVAIRKALLLDSGAGPCTAFHSEVDRLTAAALAAPRRNCDVGTAEEQAERYGRYCDKFTSDGMHCETCPCCGKIPFGKCEFAWAQMPYVEKEGGAS